MQQRASRRVQPCYSTSALNNSMRYALKLNNTSYLAACYEATGSGIRLTNKAEDACSYVTVEKALSVAIQLSKTFDSPPVVVEVEH